MLPKKCIIIHTDEECFVDFISHDLFLEYKNDLDKYIKAKKPNQYYIELPKMLLTSKLYQLCVVIDPRLIKYVPRVYFEDVMAATVPEATKHKFSSQKAFFAEDKDKPTAYFHPDGSLTTSMHPIPELEACKVAAHN